MAAKKPHVKPATPAAEWVEGRIGAEEGVLCSRCHTAVIGATGPLLRAWKAEHEKECWGS